MSAEGPRGDSEVAARRPAKFRHCRDRQTGRAEAGHDLVLGEVVAVGAEARNRCLAVEGECVGARPFTGAEQRESAGAISVPVRDEAPGAGFGAWWARPSGATLGVLDCADHSAAWQGRAEMLHWPARTNPARSGAGPRGQGMSSKP